MTPHTFGLALECRIDNPVPKRLDEGHVRLTEPASRFDVDGHLRLVTAVTAVDPSNVRYPVDGPVGNLCGELVFGAVQRDKRQLAEMDVVRRAAQIVR